MTWRIPLKGRRAPLAGQSMVEFAMVATAFLLVTFAIMQYALATFASNAVAEAASEAARYAASHSPTGPSPATNAQIQAVAINAAPGLNAAGLTVTPSWPADPNIPGKTDALVKVTYKYSLSVPFVTTVSLTLNGSSQMLVSQ